MTEVDYEKRLARVQRGRNIGALDRPDEDRSRRHQHDRHRLDEMLGENPVGDSNLSKIAPNGITSSLESDRWTGKAELLTRRRACRGLR